MIYFDNNNYLYLSGIIIILIVMWLLNQRRIRIISGLIGEQKLVDKIAISSPLSIRVLKYGIYLLAFLSMIIALAGPFILGVDEKTKNMSPTDIVFVVDVSKSMYVKDLAPDRLSRAKRLIREILDQLSSEQVGVVLFAGKANTYMPLTADYYYVNKTVDAISADLVEEKGTSLTEALKIGGLIYSTDAKKTKIMCLLTDGEFHDSGYLKVADSLRKTGIKLFSFGIGTTAGGSVPLDYNPNNEEYEKGIDNSAILSQLHPQELIRITGNHPENYIQVADKANAASLFTGQLKKIEYNEVVRTPKPYFGLLLLAAFLLLVTDVCIPPIVKDKKVSEI